MSYLDLLISSIKVSFLSFGGGNTALPIFEREFVINKQVISQKDMDDIIIFSSTLPGPVMVLASSMIGKKLKGTFGAILAVFAVIFPITFLSLLAIILFNTSIGGTSPILPFVMAAISLLMVPMITRLFNSHIKEKTNFELMIFIISILLLILGIPAIALIFTAIFIGVVTARRGEH